jgi:hypothetical protein
MSSDTNNSQNASSDNLKSIKVPCQPSPRNPCGTLFLSFMGNTLMTLLKYELSRSQRAYQWHRSYRLIEV